MGPSLALPEFTVWPGVNHLSLVLLKCYFLRATYLRLSLSHSISLSFPAYLLLSKRPSHLFPSVLSAFPDWTVGISKRISPAARPVLAHGRSSCFLWNVPPPTLLPLPTSPPIVPPSLRGPYPLHRGFLPNTYSTSRPKLPGWGLGYPRSLLSASLAQEGGTGKGGLCFTARALKSAVRSDPLTSAPLGSLALALLTGSLGAEARGG